MPRVLGILSAIILAAALPGSVAAAPVEPRVAIIVGPAEGLTDLYRSIGTAAAREARRWTSDVVTVFSPDATWPVVKQALRGASIVVYLGHGNGWPSPYRDAPYPKTQDGLGLNPAAGGGDDSHQYFGEAFLAREVRLAPGAVVLLHHLCYASGNSEPGLPEGSLDVGRQRVDNYAAGWLASGAGAVIADTFGAPDAYLRELLGTGSSPVDAIWRAAPTFHGHELDFDSVRTPGFRAAMDPTRVESGFNRSIVWRPGLAAAEMRAGAGRVAKGSIAMVRPTGPSIDSLAPLGVTFQAPTLVPAGPAPGGLVAGSRATLSLPIRAPKGVVVPKRLELGVRWDPITLEPATEATGAAPVDPTGPLAPASTATSPSPDPGGATPSPAPRGRPVPASSPLAPDPAASEPPPIVLVAPEAAGSVVSPARATLRQGKLRITIGLPAVAGTYRLVTTVHRPDGVGFDATTQSLVPALTVHVSHPLSVAYGVAPSLTVVAGSSVPLSVRVANDGALSWATLADPSEPSELLIARSVARAHPSARLVGRWVALAALDPAAPGPRESSARVQADPGTQVTVVLGLTVPSTPGPYLLVLDVDSPLHGSLAASGASPGQVRIVVVAADDASGASPAAP